MDDLGRLQGRYPEQAKLGYRSAQRIFFLLYMVLKEKNDKDWMEANEISHIRSH